MIADEDISSNVPHVVESVFGDYNWFLSAVRLGRLSSIAYTSLFSTEATLKSKASFLESIKRIRSGLEEWRLEVPVEYRPGETLQLSRLESLSTKSIAIQTQYLYYNLVIAVERLSLRVDPGDGLDTTCTDSQGKLMGAAQNVIELVSFIDIAPHMSVL